MTRAEREARHEAAIDLRRQGLRQIDIAQRLGISQARVCQLLQEKPGARRTYSFAFARRFVETELKFGRFAARRMLSVPQGSVSYVRKLAEGRV